MGVLHFSSDRAIRVLVVSVAVSGCGIWVFWYRPATGLEWKNLRASRIIKRWYSVRGIREPKQRWWFSQSLFGGVLGALGLVICVSSTG